MEIPGRGDRVVTELKPVDYGPRCRGQAVGHDGEGPRGRWSSLHRPEGPTSRIVDYAEVNRPPAGLPWPGAAVARGECPRVVRPLVALEIRQREGARRPMAGTRSQTMGGLSQSVRSPAPRRMLMLGWSGRDNQAVAKPGRVSARHPRGCATPRDGTTDRLGVVAVSCRSRRARSFPKQLSREPRAGGASAIRPRRGCRTKPGRSQKRPSGAQVLSAEAMSAVSSDPR